MKFKLFAIILGLTVVSYAQTATQTAPSTAQQSSTQSDEKKEATACQKMMEGKEGCCMHHDMAAKDGKEAMACCEGKDAKSCQKMMKKGKDKMASMCGGEKCCGKDAKDCCKHDEKEMAMACCGGSQCGMGHDDHAEEMK